MVSVRAESEREEHERLARELALGIARAQALSDEMMKDHPESAVDDLLAERRREFALEEYELARYRL